jgi:hypothetical protein
LPSRVNERLLEEANRRARDIAPKLRDLLAEPSFVAGLERFGSAISGEEMIHTSYFDHPAILDLLALHVAWGQQDRQLARHATGMQGELRNWFCSFKRSVQEDVVLPQPPAPSPLIRTRRRSEYGHTAVHLTLLSCSVPSEN